MLKTAFAFCLMSGLLLVTSCASIVSDTSYQVTIRSHPEGASFMVIDSDDDLLHQGVTPETVTLDASSGFFSKAKYKITFDKPGYAQASRSLSAKIDGWYVGNIVFGGLIGWLIVDPATGAMWKLPKNISATLRPLQAPLVQQPAYVPQPQPQPQSPEPAIN